MHIFDIITLFAAELEELKIGMWGKGFRMVPVNIAQEVERSTREHTVSGHHRLWVRIPTNTFSDEMLNKVPRGDAIRWAC